MKPLSLFEFHRHHGAQFREINGAQVVGTYGDVGKEYHAIKQRAALLDLGFRSRLCLLGADRIKFLHGQVTQDVNALSVGQGTYAALITAKGKMQSDLFVYRLADELLLDFEPGLAEVVSQRLEKYIIADDVQVVDVSEPYGHFSVQGPLAAEIIDCLSLSAPLPREVGAFIQVTHSDWGDLYLINRPRFATLGFDLFLPSAALRSVAERILAVGSEQGLSVAGWEAMEIARIESAIPRFGQDMDETNLPPEAGLDGSAISYSKGCYIGQEVMARLRTYGQVAKALRGLQFSPETKVLPRKGDKIFWSDKEIGYVTSSTASPALKSNVALGYLRRERNQVGKEIVVDCGGVRASAVIATVPFKPFPE